MISSIRALPNTYKQLVIGCANDIETTVPGEKVPTGTVSDAANHALEEAMADPDNDKETYFPVWQDAKMRMGIKMAIAKLVSFIAFCTFFVLAHSPVLLSTLVLHIPPTPL